jgi:hypothetical protein
LTYDGAFQFSKIYALDYSLEQTTDLYLDFEIAEMELYSIEGEGYFEGGMLRISYASGVLRIHREYIEELSYGEYTFLLTTSEGLIELQLLIYDTRKPYLVSSSQVYLTLGDDAVIEFKLYDGTFNSLSGNDISSEDYSIVGSTLTIDGEYIESIFTRDVERTVIILGYYISTGSHVILGYIYIRLNP